MKLYPDKLDKHLASDTRPVYLLHGDEPWQLMTLGDRLRRHAREQGFEERTVLLASDDADWASFNGALASRSLFAERRLVELRLPTGKPGRRGGEALKQYAATPPDDILLLITSARLDRSGTNSAWFKALDKVGVSIAVWPITAADLPGWLKTQARQQGLQLTDAAVVLIAERVEGNLLAASQELQRLALLYPDTSIDTEQVLDAVTDSARYSIADLAAAALAGEAVRAQRIVRGLYEEAVPPVLVLWALAQELRSGCRAAEALAHGASLDSALKGAGVWQSRLAALKVAVPRHGAEAWLSMLARASHIDRQIKGQEPGDAWAALEALAVRLAGARQVVASDAPALV